MWYCWLFYFIIFLVAWENCYYVPNSNRFVLCTQILNNYFNTSKLALSSFFGIVCFKLWLKLTRSTRPTTVRLREHQLSLLQPPPQHRTNGSKRFTIICQIPEINHTYIHFSLVSGFWKKAFCNGLGLWFNWLKNWKFIC